MKKTSKVIAMFVVLAVLAIGVGYAAIQNVTLNITGTAAADPSQSNFKVVFTGTPEKSDAQKITEASIASDNINATMTVEGLTTKGESVTATYTIQNTSADLSATLGQTFTNSNTEYFSVTPVLKDTSLTSGEATTMAVTVTLIKTPIQAAVSTNIGVQIEAEPVQP